MSNINCREQLDSAIASAWTRYGYLLANEPLEALHIGLMLNAIDFTTNVYTLIPRADGGLQACTMTHL